MADQVGRRRSTRPGRTRGRVLGALLAAGLLSGCSALEYTYVTNSAEHTHLKVPGSWR